SHSSLFFFNAPLTTELSTLSLHDALPILGSVVTGTLPSSLALSPDLSTLYVASAGSNTINTINLSTRQRGNDYNVGSRPDAIAVDRKSTRLNSSHVAISYAVFCLKKKKTQ